MHSIVKKKWHLFNTYRKVRKLWEEYKKVSQIETDLDVVSAKLTEFLDYFIAAYREMAAADRGKMISLDKISGDCAQILLNLLSMVEREAERDPKESPVAELLHKALAVAELILHDPKYSSIVRETPNVLKRFLELLDTLKTTENKRMVLRVISVIGSNYENKMEIGRLDGFRKMLKLLVAEDHELTREILATLKRFLDEPVKLPLPPEVAPLSSSVGSSSDKSLNSLLPDIFTTGSLRHIVNDVTKLVVTELHKVFDDDEDSNNGSDSEGLDHVGLLQQFAGVESTPFIPTAEAVAAAYQSLFERGESTANASLPEAKLSKSPSAVVPTGTPIPSEVGKKAQSCEEQHLVMEFMRVQGAISALTSSLKEAALAVQIDLVDMISRLIFKNASNQSEFKRLEGYAILPRLFDQIGDFDTPEAKAFVQECFSLFFTIILDGNKSKLVGNMDALELLFITLDFPQTEVKEGALRCLKDILAVNPLNVVFVQHVGGVAKLWHIIDNWLDMIDLPQEQFVMGVNDTLQYMAILFSCFDSAIFQSYLDRLALPKDPSNAAKLTQTSKRRVFLLQSVSSLTAQWVSQGSSLPDVLLPSMLELLEQTMAEIRALPHFEPSPELARDREPPEQASRGSRSTFEDIDDEPRNPPVPHQWIDQILLILEIVGIAAIHSPSSAEEPEPTGAAPTPGLRVATASDSPPAASTPTGDGAPDAPALPAQAALDVGGSDFERAGGFVRLKALLELGVSIEVTQLAIWICQEFVRQRLMKQQLGSLQIMISLSLMTTLSATTRRYVLFSLAQLLASSFQSPSPAAVRHEFRGLGGLQALLDILEMAKRSPQHKTVLYAAMYAIGEAITDCEASKVYIGERLGYLEYATILRNLEVEIDLAAFQMILELACIPSIRNALLSMSGPRVVLPHRHLHAFTRRAALFIGHIRNPRPLHVKPLDCTRAPLEEPSLSSMSLSQPHDAGSSSAAHNAQDVRNGSASSSARDSFSSDDEELAAFDLPHHADDHAQVLEPIIRADPDPGGRPVVPATLQVALSQIEVRNPDAALMVLHLLPSHDVASLPDPEAQRAMLQLLLELLEANPSNKRVFCNAHGVSVLLHLASQLENAWDEQRQTYYFELIASLGGYDLSASEVRLLFELATQDHALRPRRAAQQTDDGGEPTDDDGDSSVGSVVMRPDASSSTLPDDEAANKSRELQMQMLFVIGRIMERKTPLQFFNLNGQESALSIKQVDRFPPPRTGYTFSCWVKISHFLREQMGLLSWMDQSGHPVFELYFNSLPPVDGAPRHCLCAKTINYASNPQGAPPPAEKFVFDGYSFIEGGDWHHLTFTHQKQQARLFVDGKLIQTCTLNYPSNLTRDRISGVVGKHVINLKEVQEMMASLTHSHSSVSLNRSNRGSRDVSRTSSFSNLAGMVPPRSISFNGNSSSNAVPPFSSDRQRVMSTPNLQSLQQAYGPSPNGSPRNSISMRISGLVSTSNATSNATTASNSTSPGNTGGSTASARGVADRRTLQMSLDITGDEPEPIGYFCGQLGWLHFADGVFDDPVPHRFYARGSLWDPPLRSQGVDSKEFLSINPAQFQPMQFVVAPTAPSVPPPSPTSRSRTPSASADPHFSTDAFGPFSSALTPSSPPKTKDKEAAPGTPAAEINGGVRVHATHCLHDLIREVGGIQLCFPFFGISGPHQVAGLRILAGLLHQHGPNIREFTSLHGFHMLYRLLAPQGPFPPPGSQSKLTMETFEVLFDLMCDAPPSLHGSHGKRLIVNRDCFHLVLDLLLCCDAQVQKEVLRGLNALILSHPDNLAVIRGEKETTVRLLLSIQLKTEIQTANGLVMLLSLLCYVSDLEPLLGILRRMAPTFTMEEVEALFEFLIFDPNTVAPSAPQLTQPTGQQQPPQSPRSPAASSAPPSPFGESTVDKFAPENLVRPSHQTLQQVKVSLVDLLYAEMQVHPHIVEYLPKVGLHVIFALLESEFEAVRIGGIKLLGLLLHSNPSRNKTQFVRLNGFELVRRILLGKASLSMCMGLLALAVGEYQCSFVGEKRSSSFLGLFGNKARDAKTLLVHPEALAVLFQMLQCPVEPELPCPQPELQSQILREIERILEPDNMEILWAGNWFEWGGWWADWCIDLLQSLSRSPDPDGAPAVAAQVHRIVQRLMLYDVARKGSQLTKLKETVDDHLQLQAIIAVLEHYEAHPALAEAVAADVIANLVQLFRLVDDIDDLPSRLCRRMIDMINTIAWQNTSAVRAVLKSKGFFDIRDMLIMRLMRAAAGQELSDSDSDAAEVRADFVGNFNFESVADQRTFRDNNGIVYLVHMFLESRPDPQLQAAIFDVLKDVLGQREENKKVICALLEDTEVILRFFDVRLETPRESSARDVSREVSREVSKESSKDSPSKVSLERPGSSERQTPGGFDRDRSADRLDKLVAAASAAAADLRAPYDDYSPLASLSGLPDAELGSAEEFLEWFYADENAQRRQDVESRVAKHLAQPEAKHRANTKAIISRKMKRLRARKDRLGKSELQLNKQVFEYEEKRRARLAKLQISLAEMQRAQLVARHERWLLGEQVCKEHHIAVDLAS